MSLGAIKNQLKMIVSKYISQQETFFCRITTMMAFSYYISLKLGGRSLPLPPWTIRNKTFPSYPNLVLVRTQFVDSKFGILVELGLKLESVQTSVFTDWGPEIQTIILTENVQSWFFKGVRMSSMFGFGG